MQAAARRRVLFACYTRRLPRSGSPGTFNDKVNWRVLNDRRPVLEWTCDKLAMNDRARSVAGLRVSHTLWAGTGVGELPGALLPDDWVLKPNHRSGVVHFARGTPDAEHLQSVTAGWLHPFEAVGLGEWAYSRARPLLLAEEVIGEPGSPPPITNSLHSAAKSRWSRLIPNGTRGTSGARICLTGRPRLGNPGCTR
jgi:hypothetical protein